MLRLLHTSDWHLGRFLYGKSLLEDQEFALQRLIELIDQRKPHALLIAGDIFDRPFPPEAAVSLFDRFLNEVVSRRGVKTFLIPGNHDSCERLGFASQLLREQGLTIFASPEDAFHSVEIEGDDGVNASIFGIPFVEPPLIGRLLDNHDIRSPDAAIRALCGAILEKHKLKKSSHSSILLCHAFVTGSETCESEKDIFIGGSSNVDVAAFDGFHYTALGHLHKPQSAGRENVRYSGSLLTYSKSEVDHVKSITEVCVDKKGQTSLSFHQLPRLRSLRYVEGLLDDLLEKAKVDTTPDDYIVAGFTDSGPVLDAFARLRIHYPNILHISRAGGFMPEQLPALQRAKAGEAKTERSELDLFAEFFRDAVGEDLSDNERAFLASTLQELNSQKDGGL